MHTALPARQFCGCQPAEPVGERLRSDFWSEWRAIRAAAAERWPSVARLSPESPVRLAANAEVVFLVRNKRCSGSVLPQQFAKTGGGGACWWRRTLEAERGADTVLDECAG